MIMEALIPKENIVNKIYEIRGKKVMLSHDLADLYQVETKRLNEQVRRNIGRFPDRFMFKLTQKEFMSLRSHFATLKRGQHFKYLPYAFTEHGILMSSGVLRSKRAERVNIFIIDAFVELNRILLTHKDLLFKMEELKKKVASQDEKVQLIFNYLRRFIQEQAKPRSPIGFNLSSG
jgi:hypothetical protein